MKFAFSVLSGALLAAAAVTVWGWDTASPVVELPDVAVVGAAGEVEVAVRDSGKGLASVTIQLAQGDRVTELSQEQFAAPLFAWQQSSGEHTVRISGWKEKGLRDGEFEVRVQARDHGNLWLFRRETAASRTYRLDSIPPRIEVVSSQHYLRQGGSETILYRVSETDIRSGVQVGGNRFQGAPIGDSGLHLAIFALEYDQPTDQPVHLWAEDAAGNRTQTGFWLRTTAQSFRRRELPVTDSFIESVAPEILSRSGLSAGTTPLETFLVINRELRQRDNQRIADLTREVTPDLTWSEPFLQLSNSKVEAVFADRRSYIYRGRKEDEQTHLGFDLASLARNPVEASNRGRVVFADYLGIYGNTVILDHGLGLYSLYAHLSAIDVEVGQTVERGASLGRTGQTGLAGGDHLHYSMLVQGIQVNPIEWWDPAWVRVRVQTRVRDGSLDPLQ